MRMRSGSVKKRVGLDGEQNILQARIILIDVMHIVGGDVFRRIARAHLQQLACSGR